MRSPYIFVTSTQVILKLQAAPESLGGLAKRQIASPRARISDSAGLGSGPRVCISNRFPGDTDSGVWGAHFENRTSVPQKEKSFLVTVSLCK